MNLGEDSRECGNGEDGSEVRPVMALSKDTPVLNDPPNIGRLVLVLPLPHLRFRRAGCLEACVDIDWLLDGMCNGELERDSALIIEDRLDDSEGSISLSEAVSCFDSSIDGGVYVDALLGSSSDDFALTVPAVGCATSSVAVMSGSD